MKAFVRLARTGENVTTQYYETTCMVCRRPQNVSYPYVICKECYETSRAVDYVHDLQVRLAAYERVAETGRMIPWASVVDRVENPGDYIGDDITAERIRTLAAALRECEQV